MKFNKKTVNTVDQNQLVPKDVDVCKFDLNSDLNLNFENWRITGSSILCAKPYMDVIWCCGNRLYCTI